LAQALNMNVTYFLPAVAVGLLAQAVSGESLLLWLSIAILATWWLRERVNRFDFKAQVRFIDDRVWLGEHRLGLFPILWGTRVRNKVYQAAFWRDPIQEADLASFQFHIGITTTGELLRQPISQLLPHALLVGPTGSGKTQLVRLIASQVDAEVWVIDLTDPVGLAGIPGLTRHVSQADSEAFLGMSSELNDRALKPLNPKLLLVVENVDLVIRNQSFAQLVEQVATTGRSHNVMLLATCQSRVGVPVRVLANCASQFTLSLDYSVSKPPEATANRSASNGKWGKAKLVRGQESVEFRFPLGFENEKTAPVQTEAVNPLLTRVWSKPQ
jgi:hypothetical protein